MHFLTNEDAPRLFSFSADLLILTDRVRFIIDFPLEMPMTASMINFGKVYKDGSQSLEQMSAK